MQKVFNGNNIDLLKDYPDNYFDSVVTDPPYGLGKEPNAAELMKDWIEHGYHEISGSGFMGKEWDAFVPQTIFWKEVYRVLKPGGHILSFFGTRTYDWGVMSMRFAGFEVRDCIQWLYGSGFPKSHNIGKALDKMEGAESAKRWDGWGSALKPANEPIVLARKPLEKGLSIAENILKWGVGGINIDASRIGSGGKKWETPRGGIWTTDIEAKAELIDNPLGRFPANIILTHHEDCECKGTKKVKSDGHHSWKIPDDGGLLKLGLKQKEDEGNKYAENGKEEVENWDCHEDCPIRILDEQSGVKASTRNMSYSRGGGDFIDGIPNQKEKSWFKSEVGGASRFFYVAKASKSERNKGLEIFEDKFSASAEFRPNHMEKAIEGDSGNPYGRWTPIKNFHPTVKPIKLMQYLVKMITPPNGIVLDPFCGSGTTGIACKLDGFQFVGLEQDAEYSKIAEARIENYIKEKQIKLF